MHNPTRARRITRARVALSVLTFSAAAFAASPVGRASAQTTGSSDPTTAQPTAPASTPTPAPEPPVSAAPPASPSAPPAAPPDTSATTVAPTDIPSTAATPSGPTPSTAATPSGPTPSAATSSAPKKAPKTTKKKAKASALPAGNPSARGATSIEIDISRQTLYLYKGGKLYRSMRVSTGSGRRYCSRGSCSIARTPRGSFRIYNRIGGWRTSHLGRLFNPVYFKGGFAIHGGNIPGYPASHGCVRIPMAAARWFPGAVPNGTLVRIHD